MRVAFYYAFCLSIVAVPMIWYFEVLVQREALYEHLKDVKGETSTLIKSMYEPLWANSTLAKFSKQRPTNTDITIATMFVIAYNADDALKTLPSYVFAITAIQERYSLKHGYNYINSFHAQGDRRTSWNKIPYIYGLVQNGIKEISKPHMQSDFEKKFGRWIWVVDADVLIMNEDLLLEQHVFEKIYSQESAAGRKSFNEVKFIIAEDCNGINDGSFFLRVDDWSLAFLSVLWDHDNPFQQLLEQDCMKDMVKMARLRREMINDGKWDSANPWTNTDFNVRSSRLTESLIKLNLLESTVFVDQRIFNAYPPYCSGHYQPGDLVAHFAGDKSYVQQFIKKKFDLYG